MLDMSNIVDAIHVSSGATLELINITVRTLHACCFPYICRPYICGRTCHHPCYTLHKQCLYRQP